MHETINNKTVSSNKIWNTLKEISVLIFNEIISTFSILVCCLFTIGYGVGVIIMCIIDMLLFIEHRYGTFVIWLLLTVAFLWGVPKYIVHIFDCHYKGIHFKF